MAGIVIGAVSDSNGWSVVFLLWCVVAVGSMAFAFLSLHGGKQLECQND